MSPICFRLFLQKLLTNGRKKSTRAPATSTSSNPYDQHRRIADQRMTIQAQSNRKTISSTLLLFLFLFQLSFFLLWSLWSLWWLLLLSLLLLVLLPIWPPKSLTTHLQNQQLTPVLMNPHPMPPGSLKVGMDGSASASTAQVPRWGSLKKDNHQPGMG